MPKLNYHHLYYFWRVAKLGNLTKAAQSLHTSQSALSVQIKQLEQVMKVDLFQREGRKLVLTEAGKRALVYAEEIFAKGEELETLLVKGSLSNTQTLSIGTLSTMSRNFIEDFISPLLARDDVKYSLHARRQASLLNDLANHQFDMALTNIDIAGSGQELWQCQLLARQPVSIIGPPGLKLAEELPSSYTQYRWILPVSQSPIRSSFDSFCAQQQFQPDVLAEADDMAMLRLLARDNLCLTVLPEVVVKDELESGKLVSYLRLPNTFENFYVVTVKRQFTNRLANELVQGYLSKRT